MLSNIPIIGWLIHFGFRISLAVPFWFCWTLCNTGEKFFYFLPERFQNIGFWESVGLFISIDILKSLLVPKFVDVKQENKNEAKET